MFWFDTESTGLKPDIHDIIQMAGIIVVDNVTVERFNFKCAPDPARVRDIDDEAMKINGYTIDEISIWPDRTETFKKLISLLDKHCDKYNKKDKFIMAGHNPGFDKLFLESMAKRNNFDYLFSYIDYHILDTAQIAMLCRLTGRKICDSNKLGDLCEFFKIPLKAHDAFEDIVATRKLCGALMKLLIPELTKQTKE